MRNPWAQGAVCACQRSGDEHGARVSPLRPRGFSTRFRTAGLIGENGLRAISREAEPVQHEPACRRGWPHRARGRTGAQIAAAVRTRRWRDEEAGEPAANGMRAMQKSGACEADLCSTFRAATHSKASWPASGRRRRRRPGPRAASVGPFRGRQGSSEARLLTTTGSRCSLPTDS